MKAGRPRRLKLEQRIELARRYHAGEPPKVLAEAYGVSRRHVTRLAKEELGEGIAVRDPSEQVSFRASRSELEAFDAEWQARGYANRSQALNAVLRGRCGFLDVPRDMIAAFCASWRQAKDVSDAGLTLAKAVHRGKLVVSGEDRALLVALLDQAQGMSRELGRMKDAAQKQRYQTWPEGAERPALTAAARDDGARKSAEPRLVRAPVSSDRDLGPRQAGKPRTQPGSDDPAVSIGSLRRG